MITYTQYRNKYFTPGNLNLRNPVITIPKKFLANNLVPDNISANTEAGVYTVAVRYIATANFWSC